YFFFLLAVSSLFFLYVLICGFYLLFQVSVEPSSLVENRPGDNTWMCKYARENHLFYVGLMSIKMVKKKGRSLNKFQSGYGM
ncbi:hypothetical protein C5167_038212, partial [Papaver somniferum]